MDHKTERIEGFEKGASVIHCTFGEGVVEETRAGRIRVRFNCGRKTLPFPVTVKRGLLRPLSHKASIRPAKAHDDSVRSSSDRILRVATKKGTPLLRKGAHLTCPRCGYVSDKPDERNCPHCKRQTKW